MHETKFRAIAYPYVVSCWHSNFQILEHFGFEIRDANLKMKMKSHTWLWSVLSKQNSLVSAVIPERWRGGMVATWQIESHLNQNVVVQGGFLEEEISSRVKRIQPVIETVNLLPLLKLSLWLNTKSPRSWHGFLLAHPQASAYVSHPWEWYNLTSLHPSIILTLPLSRCTNPVCLVTCSFAVSFQPQKLDP